MPIQRSTAKRLVSETEFKLINESFPPLVGELSDKALLQRMERARKARDRYHAMVEQQRGKTSSGAQRSATPLTNLKDVISKEKIFEETLTRFERRTAKAGGSAGPQGATPMKSALKPADKGAASGKSAAGGSARQASADKAKAAAKSAGMKGGVKTPAQAREGKKSGGAKSGAQGTSKASVKMANKAAAKGGVKPVPKAGKGKGTATKKVPRGRHGAAVATTTLL